MYIYILYFLFKIHFPKNKFRFVLYLQKTAIYLELYFITYITSCIYLDNGMKDIRCSLIEYEIYFKESEN